MLHTEQPDWPAPDRSLDAVTGLRGVILRRLGRRVLPIADQRKPNLIINARVANAQVPYLRRWWLLRARRLLNVYLHNFLRDDDAGAHHDHPYLFNISIILAGECREQRFLKGGVLQSTIRRAGAVVVRFGAAPHRIELIEGKPCWTLFIAGPVVRRWGFHCRNGWVRHDDYVGPEEGGRGLGCG